MTGCARPALYLSRLLLNPGSRQVANELVHPYEMHRTLMRAFPGATEGRRGSGAREGFGLLFRVEMGVRRRVVTLFVQSRVEPDWTSLGALDGYLCSVPGAPGYECKDIMPAYRRIYDGQVLSFRLRANPTRRVGRDDDPMKGKRVEIAREQDQVEWLMRKGRGGTEGRSGGFDLSMRQIIGRDGDTCFVPEVRVGAEGKLTGRKMQAERSHPLTHAAVLFEGRLQVTDADAFLDTLVRGIGSAKAFGFGLLSIAPASVFLHENAP